MVRKWCFNYLHRNIGIGACCWIGGYEDTSREHLWLHYELHAWIVGLLGWLFLPFYIRVERSQCQNFVGKRRDSKSRWFLSLFSLIAYVPTKVSVTIYAGGYCCSCQVLGIHFLCMGLLRVDFICGSSITSSGGMKAVIYTETLQASILILGSITITYLAS